MGRTTCCAPNQVVCPWCQWLAAPKIPHQQHRIATTKKAVNGSNGEKCKNVFFLANMERPFGRTHTLNMILQMHSRFGLLLWIATYLYMCKKIVYKSNNQWCADVWSVKKYEIFLMVISISDTKNRKKDIASEYLIRSMSIFFYNIILNAEKYNFMLIVTKKLS